LRASALTTHATYALSCIPAFNYAQEDKAKTNAAPAAPDQGVTAPMELNDEDPEWMRQAPTQAAGEVVLMHIGHVMCGEPLYNDENSEWMCQAPTQAAGEIALMHGSVSCGGPASKQCQARA
jgi:hypothetical protein